MVGEEIMAYVPRILIVDDDPRMCDGLTILLSGEGYETQARHSGRDALEALTKDDFDVVLLDFVLPDISGAETMARINSATPETSVVVMTGYPSLDSAVDCLKRGAFDYVRKPFEFEELSQVVKKALCEKASKGESKQVQEALRESEEKYKTLVESSLTGIFIHQNNRYVFVNDRFAQIHGYSPEELLGKECFALIHPDEREVLAERAAARLEGRSVPGHYEVRRLRKDGKTVWCEMIATRIEYGGRPAIMGNIIDITERKRSQEALQQSKKRTEMLKFANDVALKLMDELRNPLTAVGGFSALISSREYPPDKLKEYAKIISEESARLNKAVNEVLAHLQKAAEDV